MGFYFLAIDCASFGDFDCVSVVVGEKRDANQAIIQVEPSVKGTNLPHHSHSLPRSNTLPIHQTFPLKLPEEKPMLSRTEYATVLELVAIAFHRLASKSPKLLPAPIHVPPSLILKFSSN
ncbi:hypothetical protein V6N13_138949 [Hibiscus sabdariffa]|uniref:Uncharacterized protein n=1 Tax=Hibiscus sabdariffa TaxID=183260 RepID=A0ABR2PKF7_9ROSI